MENYATWELKAMIKALSMLEILNTDEENKRLIDVKTELKKRNFVKNHFEFITIK